MKELSQSVLTCIDLIKKWSGQDNRTLWIILITTSSASHLSPSKLKPNKLYIQNKLKALQQGLQFTLGRLLTRSCNMIMHKVWQKWHKLLIILVHLLMIFANLDYNLVTCLFLILALLKIQITYLLLKKLLEVA